MSDRTKAARLLEGRVRDLSHSGDAVVETAEGIVMARGALPGERVRLRLERRIGGVGHGTLVELLDASPDRIEPACEIAGRCGGCPLMTLADHAQLPFKGERLQRVLAHHGSSLEPALVESPRRLGYRARARVGFSRGGRGVQIGYHAAGTRSLVDVTRCLVLAPALEHGYARLRERLSPVLQGRGEVALGLGKDGRCVVELISEGPQPSEVYAAAQALVENDELVGLALRVDGGAAASWGDPRQLGQGGDGEPLWAPGAAFMQANPQINEQLVARVLALAEPQGARVLELYAGHGNLTVVLARAAAELRAVEADHDAAEACRQNLLARGLSHARVVCEDAADGARGKGEVDVVVLDPPRTGAREAIPAFLARRPKRIVYVSCDLTTLRRDLGTLVQAGYRLDAAVAFDMFPQTAHLESVVRLRR